MDKHHLTSEQNPNRCDKCNGTGKDAAKTEKCKKKGLIDSGYVRCWNCNGNGLDPAAYFRWTPNNTSL